MLLNAYFVTHGYMEGEENFRNVHYHTTAMMIVTVIAWKSLHSVMRIMTPCLAVPGSIILRINDVKNLLIRVLTAVLKTLNSTNTTWVILKKKKN